MTTLQKSDGSLTTDIKENMKVMIDYINPKDEWLDDTEYYKRIRYQAKEPILTMDDSDYSPTEVKNAIDELNNKKAAGEDGISYFLGSVNRITIYIYKCLTGCHNILIFTRNL
jgi:hypothetical protein